MTHSPLPTLDRIGGDARAHGLLILGGLHEDGGTVLLLGPDEPGGFWRRFRQSPEAQDDAPDPMDRWSRRVIGTWAGELGAEAIFPSDGPPYPPFYNWALETGRMHVSPVRLLVHDQAGLWVSFRGALRFAHRFELAVRTDSPCKSCADQPCRAACPAEALTVGGYDVARCKAFLNGREGADCMARGCRVRAVCPLSQGWGRLAEQSAFHMAAFNPR